MHAEQRASAAVTRLRANSVGLIGLATLGTIATDHTKTLSASGDSLASALTGGYHLAYVVAAGCVGLGILAAFLVLRPPAAAQPETISAEELELSRETELVAA